MWHGASGKGNYGGFPWFYGGIYGNLLKEVRSENERTTDRALSTVVRAHSTLVHVCTYSYNAEGLPLNRDYIIV